MPHKEDNKSRWEIPNIMELILKPSMDVRIRPVNLDTLEDFAFLPALLYRDDPNWTPPAYVVRRRMLDTRLNPFLKENEHTAYMAFRHNVRVGCVVCGIFRQPPEGMDGTCAFFSMFDAQDGETAGKLLEAAQAYAGEKGAEMLLGPWSPNGSRMETGLLAEGFLTPYGYLNAYNAREYPGYLEENGFSKHLELFTWQFNTENAPAVQAGPDADWKAFLSGLESGDAAAREQATHIRNILELRKDELKPFSSRLTGFYEAEASACAFTDISAALTRAHGRALSLRKPKDAGDTLSLAQVTHARSDDAYTRAFGKLLGLARSAGIKQVITAATPEDDKRMKNTAGAFGGTILNTYRIYARAIKA